MKALASFAMRSRSHAMLVVVIFTALTLFVPLFSYVCAAVIGLVTLRNGISEGLLVLVVACVLLGVTAFVSNNGSVVTPLILTLFGMSALLIIAAHVLRTTNSLPISLMVAGGTTAFIVLGFHFYMGDSLTVWWKEVLHSIFAPVLDGADQQAITNITQIVDNGATHMTGFFAAAILMNTFVCLFLARWWQAMLFNPGGFRQEFHQLRFLKPMAMITLILAIIALIQLGGLSLIAKDLLLIVLTLYVLQGLSVVHAVVEIKKLQTIWLVGAYILVIFMSQIIAFAGYIDTWVDFRRRLNSAPAV